MAIGENEKSNNKIRDLWHLQNNELTIGQDNNGKIQIKDIVDPEKIKVINELDNYSQGVDFKNKRVDGEVMQIMAITKQQLVADVDCCKRKLENPGDDQRVKIQRIHSVDDALSIDRHKLESQDSNKEPRKKELIAGILEPSLDIKSSENEIIISLSTNVVDKSQKNSDTNNDEKIKTDKIQHSDTPTVIQTPKYKYPLFPKYFDLPSDYRSPIPPNKEQLDHFISELRENQFPTRMRLRLEKIYSWKTFRRDTAIVIWFNCMSISSDHENSSFVSNDFYPYSTISPKDVGDAFEPLFQPLRLSKEPSVSQLVLPFYESEVFDEGAHELLGIAAEYTGERSEELEKSDKSGTPIQKSYYFVHKILKFLHTEMFKAKMDFEFALPVTVAEFNARRKSGIVRRKNIQIKETTTIDYWVEKITLFIEKEVRKKDGWLKFHIRSQRLPSLIKEMVLWELKGVKTKKLRSSKRSIK